MIINCMYCISMFSELNQNGLSFGSRRQVRLQSPNIFAYKACFTFQYKAGRYTSLDGSRMFIYVQEAKEGNLLPVKDKLLYYDNSKWDTVMTQISIETGFTQVSFYMKMTNISLVVVLQVKVSIGSWKSLSESLVARVGHLFCSHHIMTSYCNL